MEKSGHLGLELGLTLEDLGQLIRAWLIYIPMYSIAIC